jgi:ketosteroid isomerase-like protein
MAEEPTTPDLEELSHRLIDAIDARDFDAVASFYAPDAVYIPRGSVEGVLRAVGRYADSLKTGPGRMKSSSSSLTSGVTLVTA